MAARFGYGPNRSDVRCGVLPESVSSRFIIGIRVQCVMVTLIVPPTTPLILRIAKKRPD